MRDTLTRALAAVFLAGALLGGLEQFTIFPEADVATEATRAWATGRRT